MSIEVRPARPEEFAEAGRVTADAYREFARDGDPDWAEYLERIADVEGRAAATTVLVAIEEGRIVGTATLELDGRIDDDHGPLERDEAHIRMLGVHTDARRRGVAKALMTGCEDRSRAAGRTLLTLNTTQRMQAAQKMYESLGYSKGEDRVFPDGFVLLSYAKRLD